nr:hypothetical protein [uncultured bacterium]
MTLDEDEELTKQLKHQTHWVIPLDDRRYLWQLENAVIDKINSGIQNAQWVKVYQELAYAIIVLDAFLARCSIPAPKKDAS